ncbi:organic solvent tolerance protein [Novosphingobium sp. PC22D]|uniref:LPS-assembly protein LptD n=1 Tax=Novosphingobium sp. PC22D TaxID=1962403 RepID=UPI000BF172E8|nr:LPS assembly protein LptD [Novosphingobium sp. PC22D]PEQ13761.1 organic solvent tolerance protein [Novosphingobium sp. PC22D]
MLPAASYPVQALVQRLRPLPLSTLALALCTAWPAQLQAQDFTPPAEGPPPVIAEPPPETADAVPIAFEADRIEYAEDADTVTASGNVVLRKDDQSVAAETVTWNRETGEIVASGNVRMVDQDGNQLYTERVELTDELKTGAMQNLLIALRQGGRLAAEEGRRIDNGNIILSRAAYTGCAIEDAEGCPKSPSWRVTAREVVYDDTAKRVSFKGARLVLFEKIALPLPGLRITTDGRAVSGVLIPDFRLTPSNGVEISQPYYLRIDENRDLTATAFVYTKVAPMAQVEYRALTEKGAYQITGYATASSRIPIFGSTPTAESDFRGYLEANGRLQFDENWSVTGSIRRSTDRTFLRRYDINRDDRLRSMVELERIDQDSYFSLAGWATQTMRVNAVQGQIPVALPVLDYRHRFDDPVLGGKFETQVNTLAIQRSAGQDTQRAFASGQWTLRKLTAMGQEITLTGLVRGDVYHSDENDLTTTEIYRGNSGWEARGIATAALDVRWPFVGQFAGGTQVLTPRVQIVASPSIKNLDVPNEDARAIDLETSNLFALNRFPGYDRIEDGVRFTYGLDWNFERPRWAIKATVGQSIRLTDEPTLLPDGTGLTSKTSDFVGRTEVRYRDLVSFVHRFRLDKDNLAIRRNEFDATVGNTRTYAEIGYVKLNRDIPESIEDLQDREEARVAGRVAFARYWSLFGSAVVNLTNRSDDPVFGSDGFQPLRTRMGIAYEDDCLEIALTWRRNYTATGDARRGDSFQVRFALRNIGIR